MEVRWPEGHETSLAKLRGRVVVLDFWGYWCIPCVEEMPQLMDIAGRFEGRPVEWIAIHNPSVANLDELDRKVSQCKQWAWNNRDLPFRMALDLPAEKEDRFGTTGGRYYVRQWPTLVVIDQEGNVFGPVEKEHLAEKIDGLLEPDVDNNAIDP